MKLDNQELHLSTTNIFIYSRKEHINTRENKKQFLLN